MRTLRNAIQANLGRLWLRRNRPAFVDHGGARRPRLYVDVSVIVRNDAGTGIQRVVRSVWSHLQAASTNAFDVVPVHSTKSRGYCYAPLDFLSKRQSLGNAPVGVKAGDHFLGLDLAAHHLPRWGAQIDAWRTTGAHIHVVVYDLLPWFHPDWFPPETSNRFADWLRSITTRADQLLCISEEVATELDHLLSLGHRPVHPRIGRLHLSGDVSGSVPSVGVCAEAARTLDQARSTPTVLMVGTVEPRKAYDQALAAFELLWKSGREAPSLLIIGRPGWKTSRLQARIRAHPEFGRRLHWLHQASDEALDQAYTAARAVLVASHAEGFGLPLAEAAMHRRWALVRDLAVFREQRLPNAQYFADDSAWGLAKSIERIVGLANQGPPPEADLPHWSGCVDKLIAEIGLGEMPSPTPRRQQLAAI